MELANQTMFMNSPCQSFDGQGNDVERSALAYSPNGVKTRLHRPPRSGWLRDADFVETTIRGLSYVKYSSFKKNDSGIIEKK